MKDEGVVPIDTKDCSQPFIGIIITLVGLAYITGEFIFPIIGQITTWVIATGIMIVGHFCFYRRPDDKRMARNLWILIIVMIVAFLVVHPISMGTIDKMFSGLELMNRS